MESYEPLPIKISGEIGMSVLTFPLMMDIVSGKFSLEDLCELLAVRGIAGMDLTDAEVQIYKKQSILAAFSKYGLRCECLIAHMEFVSPKRAGGLPLDCN